MEPIIKDWAYYERLRVLDQVLDKYTAQRTRLTSIRDLSKLVAVARLHEQATSRQARAAYHRRQRRAASSG